ALLHSGSALGKKVGPLLITRREKFEKQALFEKENLYTWLKHASIAIPGKNTTANLLFSLAFPQAKKTTELLFSQIEHELLSGSIDAGLIIHENRFTYSEKGLVKILDLGDWWEQETHTAIPLGGIVIKRSIDKSIASKADALIQESLRYSWSGYPELPLFVKANAREMDEEVMRKHIELYVNQHTANLGSEGIKAVETLFEKGKEAGMTNRIPEEIFY